jgi:hypothetical protein
VSARFINLSTYCFFVRRVPLGGGGGGDVVFIVCLFRLRGGRSRDAQTMIGRFLQVLFAVLDCPLARLVEPVWILYAIVIHMAIQKALGRYSPLAWTLSRMGEGERADNDNDDDADAEGETEVVKISNRLIGFMLLCEWLVANWYWFDARYEAALVAYVSAVGFFMARVLFVALVCTYLYDNLEEARLAKESKQK